MVHYSSTITNDLELRSFKGNFKCQYMYLGNDTTYRHMAVTVKIETYM